ncbi:hypothetical protein AGMMS49921_12850 [Endomicrobiia bacterium]|nr:hypothetical protein AGMMS49921_12850 [Endomicrobiia bacterium]
MKLKTIVSIFAVFCFSVYVQACGKYQLTSEEKIIKITKKSKQSSHLSQACKVSAKTLLDKTPTPGTILKEIVDKETGAIILELSNGAKVILKNTAEPYYQERDRAFLSGLAKGGTMAVTSKDDIPSARFATGILDCLPYTPDSPTDNDAAYLRANINAFERCVKGYSSVKDTKKLFELIYQKFTGQDFDLGKVKNLVESGKKLSYRESESSIMINKVLYNNPHFYPDYLNNYSHCDFLIPYPNHSYSGYAVMSDCSKITPERTIEFLKKCFNPADFTFVFVGNIDIETFKTYIKKYIASITRSETLNNQKFTRPKPSKQEIYTDNKFETGVIRMSWVIDEKYSQKLKVASKVLEAYINIVLYSTDLEPICGVYLNPFFDELYADIRYDWDDFVKPNERISNVFKHMKNIAKGKINMDVFSKAKKAVRGLYGHEEGCTNDDGMASSYACSAVWHNAPLSEFERFPLVCEAVSSKDLKDLALRLLKGKYYQIIVYPKEINGAK